ncbi:FHIP family protein AGAP011705 isoform X2 [Chironomus tepperi]|uniref:FHIP family protein AGAP011705 isoform X2 n=1 Tax=Chironomus tepperi TaxID=113505 RepID=UPI00391F9CE0
MSWLRSSPLRQSFTRRTQDITQTGTDSKAVFDSFCKHWQQVNEIISRSENRQTQHDDVLAVVNHLDQMVTLLLVELHNCNKITLPNAQQPPAPCLEFMLSENLLDRLFEWSLSTGRYSNGVRLKQLKLYELLVSHSRHQLLVHEPFLRPLLKLLASCQNEIFPDDVSKRLVILLNQLCVVLMQNVHLLDLFFCSTQQHGQQISGANQTNFIIFSLLIPFVHCDGSIGHQARDALLLCMSLSQKNSNIGTYIANHSSMSPVLVTGLCGLYSSLPNSIEIQSIDWFRITADDVNEMPELTLFMNSLEFCNAVVQVAHPLIRDQLLDFLYQGFLVPVLGPAILQTNIESQIAAMVYLDLILRSVTEPGLLKIMIKFLLDDEKFDGERILDILIDRINSHDSRLCMVTLALFDTILGLYNEQLIMELILKYLIGAPHIPIAQKHKINKIHSYAKTVDYFLELAPEAMKNSNMIIAEHKSLDYQQPASLPTNIQSTSNSISRTIGANWNHFGLHNTGESLYSNYHAYLYDAHQKIKRTKQSCDQWTENYFYKSPQKEKRLNAKMPNEQLVQMIQNFLTEFSIEPNTTTTTTMMTGEEATNSNNVSSSSKQLDMDSLQSIGESSGYESMKYRPDDDDDQCTDISQKNQSHISDSNQISTTINSNVTVVKNIEPWRISRFKDDQIIELELSEDAFSQGTVSLGPFLTSIWSKLQTFTSNLLYVNLHLTGLISHIALYPLPLVHSILLRPDIPTTSDIPSFYQVLKILKQQIDAELPFTEDSLELIDIGRTFLIDREFKLINARKIALESLKTSGKGTSTSQQSTSQSGHIQASHLQAYDPFKRQDEKRKSSGNSIMNIFRRTPATPSSSSQNNNSSINSATNQAHTSGFAQIYGFLAGIATNLRDQPNSLELQPTMNDSSALILNVNERHRDLAISAVVMDEFLKELSAISQEMSIVLLNENFMR